MGAMDVFPAKGEPEMAEIKEFFVFRAGFRTK